MNDAKTEFIIFGNRVQVKKCILSELNIDRETVGRSQVIRYLGAWLDSGLSLKPHVKKKCATAMINLQRIKNIRKYLMVKLNTKLEVTLCLWHLDYSNSILAGLSDSTINQMQRIQNYGAKLVLGKTRYCSSKQALAELHWLPIKSRMKFKILTIVYKCLREDAPDYLRNLLVRCPPKLTTLDLMISLIGW